MHQNFDKQNEVKVELVRNKTLCLLIQDLFSTLLITEQKNIVSYWSTTT